FHWSATENCRGKACPCPCLRAGSHEGCPYTNDLLHLLRADFYALQRSLVGRKSSQRFSVRYVSHGVCSDDVSDHLAGVWPQNDRRAEKLEHRSADTGRRSAGAHGQARHAHDGRTVNWMFRNYLDIALGATFESLRLDYGCGDARIWRSGFRRRLSEAGKATQPGTDGAPKTNLPVHYRVRSLDSALHFHTIL